MEGTLRLEIVLPQAAAEFAKLPTAVRSLLRLCDGTRTIDALCQAGPLAAAEVRRVASRLVALGLVTARADERKRRKQLSERTLQWLRDESGFSSDEEAFFARPVEPLLEA